jgi:hypothetical protein
VKRSIALFISLVGMSMFAFGENPQTLIPKTARDMGLGGSFLAVSPGFASLYGNPAGFAAEKDELTILDTAVWAYVKPTSDNISKLQQFVSGGQGEDEMISLANDLLTDNGLGGGCSLGIGYVGKGLGIGFYAVSDEFASGETAMGAKLTSATAVNAVIGLGVPLRIGGLRLNLGGDARPFYRVDSTEGGWSLIDLIQGADIENQSVQAGFGLAMDFGATLEIGAVTVGLSVRDLSPSFVVDEYLLGDVLSALGAGSLPEADSDAEKAIMTPYINAGLAWKPKLIPGLVEPGLYFELSDPVGAIQDKDSFWNLLHAGADLKFLSFATLRAGVNRGWLSAGVGLDLLIVELDAAVFTEELGRHPGDLPRSGVIVQAAIRF